jgi:aminopeptidase N
MEVVDPEALHASRNALRHALAFHLKDLFLDTYRNQAIQAPYSPDAASAGKRALRNLALSYLMELETTDLVALCYEQFGQQDEKLANMTDQFAALACLANSHATQRTIALESFYGRWKDEPLIVDKWLSVQAASRLPGTLARVRELLAHPAFDIKVPNKVYSLIRAFAGNHVRFHAADGGGYEFLADQVLALNELNPQVAARMARGFDRWKRFDAGRRDKAKKQLERIRDASRLSKDVAEIVEKALA